jgi:gliding motility-associated-like protein
MPTEATLYLGSLRSMEIVRLLSQTYLHPNQDGVNDTFEIGALPKNCRLYIYDRWGKLIFESGNYNNEWNGEGELAAVYFYVLETPDGKRMKGNILVLND